VGNLGFTEILIILLVVLLLFGAKRLPEVGASIGKGIREFKRSLSETQDAIMGNDEPRTTLPPRQPEDTPEGTKSSGEPKRLSQQ
jgi:sec-independent protein translocase protein TatA